jgi:hypothetical protein
VVGQVIAFERFRNGAPSTPISLLISYGVFTWPQDPHARISLNHKSSGSSPFPASASGPSSKATFRERSSPDLASIYVYAGDAEQRGIVAVVLHAIIASTKVTMQRISKQSCAYHAQTLDSNGINSNGRWLKSSTAA